MYNYYGTGICSWHEMYDHVFCRYHLRDGHLIFSVSILVHCAISYIRLAIEALVIELARVINLLKFEAHVRKQANFSSLINSAHGAKVQTATLSYTLIFIIESNSPSHIFN